MALPQPTGSCCRRVDRRRSHTGDPWSRMARGAQCAGGQGDRERGQARNPGDTGDPVFIFFFVQGLRVCVPAGRFV